MSTYYCNKAMCWTRQKPETEGVYVLSTQAAKMYEPPGYSMAPKLAHEAGAEVLLSDPSCPSWYRGVKAKVTEAKVREVEGFVIWEMTVALK